MFALLDTLIAVYETGQFTAAADELKISQSTVSTRIAQLEREVGAPLFERKAKSDVTPTPQGRLLYRAAVSVTRIWRDAQEDAGRMARRLEPFTMLFSHTTSHVVLSPAMDAARPHLKRFAIRAEVMNSEAVLEHVGLKQAQLGIIEKPVTNESVIRTTLMEDELVLAGDDDAHAVWLLREPGSGVRYYTDLYLKGQGIVPDASVVVASNDAIMSLLADGFGRSVVSRATVPDHVPYTTLGPEFTRRFYAITPRSGLTHAQQAFADHIIDTLTTYRSSSSAGPTS